MDPSADRRDLLADAAWDDSKFEIKEHTRNAPNPKHCCSSQNFTTASSTKPSLTDSAVSNPSKGEGDPSQRPSVNAGPDSMPGISMVPNIDDSSGNGPSSIIGFMDWSLPAGPLALNDDRAAVSLSLLAAPVLTHGHTQQPPHQQPPQKSAASDYELASFNPIETANPPAASLNDTSHRQSLTNRTDAAHLHTFRHSHHGASASRVNYHHHELSFQTDPGLKLTQREQSVASQRTHLGPPLALSTECFWPEREVNESDAALLIQLSELEGGKESEGNDDVPFASSACQPAQTAAVASVAAVPEAPNAENSLLGRKPPMPPCPIEGVEDTNPPQKLPQEERPKGTVIQPNTTTAPLHIPPPRSKQPPAVAVVGPAAADAPPSSSSYPGAVPPLLPGLTSVTIGKAKPQLHVIPPKRKSLPAPPKNTPGNAKRSDPNDFSSVVCAQRLQQQQQQQQQQFPQQQHQQFPPSQSPSSLPPVLDTRLTTIVQQQPQLQYISSVPQHLTLQQSQNLSVFQHHPTTAHLAPAVVLVQPPHHAVYPAQLQPVTWLQHPQSQPQVFLLQTTPTQQAATTTSPPTAAFQQPTWQ